MLIPFLIPFVIAIFLAINMGGSGTAPAFSAAYGANIIKKSLIPGMFGVCVFLGAIIGGEQTANTVGREILDGDKMSFIVVSIILFSIAISIMVSNLLGIPQSTSQSTVFAVSGAALYYGCFNQQKVLFEIMPTWIIMPVISFILSLLIGKYIYKPLRKKGYTISRQVNENYILKGLIVLMSMYVAFAIGTNNVANAVGPVAVMANNELNISEEHFIHVLILATLIVAPSFGIGSSIFGHKVLKSTGKEIILFGRIEAVIIAFISGTLLFVSSILNGIPTSLVQLNVAAIIGIGVAKLGFKNIFKKTEVNKFFIMWVISPIIAFALSILLMYMADIMEIL